MGGTMFQPAKLRSNACVQSRPGTSWRRGPCRLALAICALALSAAAAQADDWDDCNSTVVEKILAGCNAVIAQGIRGKPDIVKAYISRAGVYARRGNVDQAFADAESALKLDPQAVGALLHRGAAHRQKGRTEAAFADYDRVIEIDPKNANAFALRGGLRAARREWTQAMSDFDQSLALRPDYWSTYISRGHVNFETGALDKAIADFDRAMADFNQALKLRPKYAEALAARGMGWQKKREYANALADLDQAIAQEERVESYYARAQIYEIQGNADRAVADFHKASELAPKGPFDVVAQADAKKRIEQLSKRVPCGGSGRTSGNDTCL
jgi:tetratricopeptide (TPR) repeat protein